MRSSAVRCALVSVALLGACGRLGFETRETSDGASDAATCHSGTFGPPTLLAPLATVSEEGDPWISADELTLYFDSNRSGGMQRAIYRTTRMSRTEPFGPPTLIAELDSSADDYDPTLSSDALTIYFGSRRNVTSELFVATRGDTQSAFGPASPLVINGDAAQKNAPDVSGDELTLYYATGPLEIAVAQRATASDPFTFVREVDEVNAPPTDSGPTLTPDGLELFFDTFRNGPAAIFRATRASTTDAFSAPVEVTELGAIPGGMGAGAPSISADGKTLYYYINTGQVDLYTATRSCD